MTRNNFLQLQPFIRPVPAQVTSKYFTVEKGRQNFVSNVTLYPCERSCQNHLEWIGQTLIDAFLKHPVDLLLPLQIFVI